MRTETNHENRQRNSSITIQFDLFTFIRGALIITALLAIVLNSIYGYALPHGNVDCLLDKTFEATAGINEYLKDHKGVRNALLIFSSLCVDLMILSMFFYWFLWGRSWRIVFALIIFYAFRSLVQVRMSIILVIVSNEISRGISLGISRLSCNSC
jgi:hypothetical protein